MRNLSEWKVIGEQFIDHLLFVPISYVFLPINVTNYSVNCTLLSIVSKCIQLKPLWISDSSAFKCKFSFFSPFYVCMRFSWVNCPGRKLTPHEGQKQHRMPKWVWITYSVYYFIFLCVYILLCMSTHQIQLEDVFIKHNTVLWENAHCKSLN